MIKLKKICAGYPESYEAYDGDTIVGYLRLRWGHFTVVCPDVGGHFVYEADPKGDGEFEDDERDYYLKFAVDAIQQWQKNGPEDKIKPSAPDVEYIIEE